MASTSSTPPEISKGGLFHTSGHLPYYADTMFPPMLADEERDAEGNITKAGQEYYLKAMNCPDAQPHLPLPRTLLP